MTQDKELLLKDLCARLPYGVKGIVEDGIKVTTPSEWPVEKSIEFSMRYMVIKNGWRPYLFPLSSITEEQKEELKNEISKQTDILIERMKNDDCGIDCGKYHFHSLLELEWLLKNHFDYRGLIPKGLAIDATGLNIY